ncbi:uncharacterized protein LOC133186256 [Saccostrea echinata]|uniref:uncharacterized protein LOC133186256 n=1 Tax=Saccostrea echinata TaxID=191078 RepID=UPI002A7FF478|nr:uncharacterized protein LOC133186256 [Saccostrea echinata]
MPKTILGGWSLYGPLSEWTTCTTSCGKGFQHRTRHRICNNPEPQHGGKDCVGLVHRDWSEWNNCPVSCGGGVQQSVRTRACNETKQGRNNCKESNETKEQRFDGHWSLFIPLGDWSQCSSSCNNGTKTRVRIRTCSEPVPLYGGKPCVGQSMSTDTITCNTQPCSGKEDPKQKTIIIIALVSSILILLGGLLIFFYCRYKRIPKTESTPQRQPEVYEEIQSMDIVNNIYVPSYAEYIHNPRFLNRPNPGTALPFPSLFVNIQRTESTLTSNTNDCRLSEIVGHRKSNEMNEETAVGVKHNFKLSEVDESKMAICPRNESGSTDKEEYFDVANSITEDCPVDGYEKPMLKSRNSYITVLPDESKKPEETATKDQQDYLECCHDIDESVKN